MTWLSLVFDVLGNMCIVINCFSRYDVINFEINLSFLVKSFSRMAKKKQDKNL